ncbi:MAG: FAD-dependent oxidoreductase [Acidobacteria bacterium]|nr:FAD-dependent oxidoreductase [Acidobacteriota bacterium]
MATSIRPLRVPAGPPMAVSLRSTRELPTGAWRTFRPKYVKPGSPCNLDCPAGTNVREFLARAADGDAVGAWRTIRATNPLPGICGRVCYHPCENGCNREAVDEAVAIHAVERAIADEARRLGARPDPAPLALPPRLVAVIGAGPAGLSCAYQLACHGHQVTVVDAMARPGGLLRYGIPAYRLPREVLDHEIALLHQMGVRFVGRTRIGANFEDLGTFDAVFVAVGLQRSKDAGVAGQETPGVRPGLDFLRQVNMGRGEPLAGPVVVIGGGNTALDAARAALRLGGEPTVLYRRSREDMPAHPDEIAQAEREGVQFVFHAAPTRFLSANGHLSGLEVQRMRPGRPDASGRSRPEPIPGAIFEVAATLALTAIGEELERDAVVGLTERAGSYLKADRFGRTSRRAVFAGGDAATGAGTVVEAIGSGRRAADAIVAHFEGRDVVAEHQAARLGVEGLNLYYFPPRPRANPPYQVPPGGVRQFDETIGGLTWAEAAAEAGRCFQCGLCTHCDNCVTFCPDNAVLADPATGGYAIDLAHCKGCGICVAECPRGAVTLVPEELR